MTGDYRGFQVVCNVSPGSFKIEYVPKITSNLYCHRYQYPIHQKISGTKRSQTYFILLSSRSIIALTLVMLIVAAPRPLSSNHFFAFINSPGIRIIIQHYKTTLNEVGEMFTECSQTHLFQHQKRFSLKAILDSGERSIFLELASALNS